MYYTNKYVSPLGNMIISSDGDNIVGLWFEGQKYFGRILDNNIEEKDLPIFNKAKKWLDTYFGGNEPKFVLPIKFVGTKFQIEVWNIIKTIPYGKTITYGEIANIIEEKWGKKMSAQAVGSAVGHNNIVLIVPCHRVVGKGNKLVGYAGGVDKKRRLLEIEKVII